MKGEVILPGGDKIKFDTDKPTYSIPITDGFGEEVTVKLTSDKKAYAMLEWEGVPLREGVGTESCYLDLEVRWLDEDGMPINPISVRQGETFWGHFRVKSYYSSAIEEIALVQIIPAGWEIENIRLSGEYLPEWTKGFILNREEYVDIRDDRIMWFFDRSYRRQTFDFLVKLNAVTVGKFFLPPTKVEAMYDNRFRATVAGKEVEVIGR